MAIETHYLRPNPDVWVTGDYPKGPNGTMVSLHSIRCSNTTTVAVRIKATTGRGVNTVQHALVVQPGEDKTLPAVPNTPPFPITVAGSDLGIVVEQV